MATDWSDWIGREARAAERLDESLAAHWLATLDLSAPEGAALPQGIHFALCTPQAPTAMLGEDGHPARSDDPASLYPPIDLPRRMWAGSEIAFVRPLMLGDRIDKLSRVVSLSEKEGRSGRLAFLELEHEIAANGEPAIRERQTLVYREAAAPDAPLVPPVVGEKLFDPQAWDRVQTMVPSEALLFRFSALTFNTHRIHYDAPYAREMERYRGPVVHGPLLATLLLQLAAEVAGPVGSFGFSARSPAIVGDTLHLAVREQGDTLELAALNDAGAVLTTAHASR
ncbi:MaoC family dehydratase N-terminal domain-containing protein [Erythrobacter sp. YJ-T3-07]|uniref:FAS1-like dehydratase domain-containing protein n=1 Tax=Erythrobacter sp. YJ-T3-07 TaxID=2793063 RepID=UPI0018D2F262|nr:MaoC family dehydratase N-terminal domain-containing protein [Erythrobacter sp. YJ-T3-07]MBH1943071.1 MaoC family dehydratase N-terminal domain-containing protein [Erythrobacter sp. YJ-T3-07]